MSMAPISRGVQGRAVANAAFINVGPGEQLKPHAFKIARARLID
jgi:hypothetical protein